QVVLGHAQFGGNFAAARLALEFLGERGAGGGKLLGAAPDPAHGALMVDYHDAVGDAHLVAVRGGIIEHDSCRDAWPARIGDIDDRGAKTVRVRKMPDKSIARSRCPNRRTLRASAG